MAGVTRLELALPIRQTGAFPDGYTPVVGGIGFEPMTCRLSTDGSSWLS